ncbi:hypothetical protein L0F63_004844 [Massospora cicadina]|nr:hypothetical protein L0F63_004844 [Massospora cicadina]
MSTEGHNLIQTLKFEHASATLPKASTEIKAKRSSRASRSWIFTKGYARRTRNEELSCHVECLVAGCGKTYTSHDGSTSNISRHLLRAHGIAKGGDANVKLGLEYVEQKASKSLPSTELSSKLPSEVLNKKLLEFALELNIPFEIVDSPLFKDFLRTVQKSPPIDSISLYTALSLEANVSSSFALCKEKQLDSARKS